MIPFQSYLITGAASALIAFGAGWTVKGWQKGAQANKAHQEALEQANEQVERQKELTQDEIDRADRLSSDLRDTRQALFDAQAMNATLAASRASTTTRIIEQGEQIANELENDYPCVRVRIPDRLISYANGEVELVNPGPSLAGPYP